MAHNQEIRTGRHCVFAMHVHLVFVTKFRHPVFGDKHLQRLEQVMAEVCQDFEATLIEFNGEAEHVHLLVNYPPKVSVSRLVNSLKGSLRACCARSSPSCDATIGGPTSCGPALITPARPAGPH